MFQSQCMSQLMYCHQKQILACEHATSTVSGKLHNKSLYLSEHTAVMSFFCYHVHNCWYFLGCVYRHLWQYVIQKVCIQMKRMAYLISGYIVYCQYISFRQRTQILIQEETETQWTIMYSPLRLCLMIASYVVMYTNVYQCENLLHEWYSNREVGQKIRQPV